MYREWESTVNLDYLKCLHTAQLLDLLEDDETIRDTVRVNSKSRGLQRSKIMLQASNSRLAEQNFIYQPYLTKTKLLLAEKHRDLGELVSSVRRRQRKLETLQQRFNLRVIHSSLKEKIDFSLRESKVIL
ncbi:vacuolar protein sorting-associated protein 37B-like isoform X2 [Triplophysa rosa]|uniref:vacuolar protein sorting-associated protein 37B-like isoform X2 n=1 Tax=Triplophysa rosa TaxID=992332 RepID=UPI002545C64D|nr:vacuolar protein sorting-associated protein 37B-like isoform X2 [Triplophysa rosa]